MALKVADRVLETSTTTGTGTLTLAGAVTGWQTFAAIGDGNTCHYHAVAVDADGIPTGDWEVGLGTYTASGTTLARTTVYASSNAGAAVDFAAGTKYVAVVRPGAAALQIFPFPGAAVGTHQIELENDGTNQSLVFRGTNAAQSIRIYHNDSTTLQLYRADFNNLVNLVVAFIGVGDGTGGIATVESGVMRVDGTNGAGSTKGWLQLSAGRTTLAADVTNATITPANLTGLTIATLKASRKYSFELVLFAEDSVAGEGFLLDFDGGTATMTDFRAHATIHDAALLLSTQVTALATDIAVATMTGASLVIVRGGFTVTDAGTFIPRFAQNSHSTGTATVRRGSYLWVDDMP